MIMEIIETVLMSIFYIATIALIIVATRSVYRDFTRDYDRDKREILENLGYSKRRINDYLRKNK